MARRTGEGRRETLHSTLDSCVVKDRQDEKKQHLPMDSFKKLDLSRYRGESQQLQSPMEAKCNSTALKLNPVESFVNQPRAAESPVTMSRCSFDVSNPPAVGEAGEAFTYDMKSYMTEPLKTMQSCGRSLGKRPR